MTDVLPEDLTAEQYRREARRMAEHALVPGITPQRDRLMGAAQVYALCALSAALEAPAPGPCWADAGIIWPDRDVSTRCELRAGHAGAHEAGRGSMGARAVWTNAEGSDS